MMTHRFRCSTLLQALNLALVAVVAFAAQPALAQGERIRDVEERWVVVTRAEEPMRCSYDENFYAVAMLEQGQVLRLDGQGASWGRVHYPRWQPAVLSATSASVDGDEAVLTAPASLKALYPENPATGSWRSVFLESLPSGTRLDLMETISGQNGRAVAYLVRPPSPPVVEDPARAFVKLEALRDATQAEIDAYTAKIDAGMMGRPSEVAPQPVEDAVEAPADDDAGATTDQPEMPAGDGAMNGDESGEDGGASDSEGDGLDLSLLDDPVVPTAEEIADAEESPAADVPADDGGAEDGEATDEAPAPAPIEPLLIEQLDEELARVRRLGREALDETLDELIGEFTRGRAEAEDEYIRDAFDRRISWLELRKATRDERRRIDALLTEASRRDTELAERLRNLVGPGLYTVVGRLTPSALYNDDQLPLMYRVESVGPEATRTLGYVRPNEGITEAAQLGSIVGIVGESRLDSALGLRVITPSRIDLLNAAAEPIRPEPTTDTGAVPAENAGE